MNQKMTSMPEELKQLQQQFAEFRSTHPLRSRLPEPLWASAAAWAAHYGVRERAGAAPGLRRPEKACGESEATEAKRHCSPFRTDLCRIGRACCRDGGLVSDRGGSHAG